MRHAGVVDMDAHDNNNTCEECHTEFWWHGLNAPSWAADSDTDLCRSMKGAGTPARFIDHIVRDCGGSPFIETAFIGKRGLNEAGETIYEAELKKKLIAAPPPGSHALFVQLARAWVAAQGGKFVGDLDCGCEIAEFGELYQLDVEYKNDTGFQGIRVTDKVQMKVRIVDETVTVYEITNFASSAAPESLTFPTSSVVWVPAPGPTNVASATGELLGGLSGPRHPHVAHQLHAPGNP